MITYDTRGISRSTREDRTSDIPVAVQADDLHLLVRAVTSEPVCIFANSGGAIISLELLTRHPEQVRSIIAHEPAAVAQVQPDACEHRAVTAEIHTAYRRDGLDVAWPMFLAYAGMDADVPDEDAEPVDPPDAESQAAMQGDGDEFLAHMLVPITNHHLEIDDLRARSSSIVVAAGAASPGQLSHQTAHTIAGLLDTPLVTMPGGHLGFADHPTAFAAHLRQVLHRPSIG